MTFQSSHSNVRVQEELISRKAYMPAGSVAAFDSDGKVIPLGYTPENLDAKETIALDNSTFKYPSNKVVKDAIASINDDSVINAIIFG